MHCTALRCHCTRVQGSARNACVTNMFGLRTVQNSTVCCTILALYLTVLHCTWLHCPPVNPKRPLTRRGRARYARVTIPQSVAANSAPSPLPRQHKHVYVSACALLCMCITYRKNPPRTSVHGGSSDTATNCQTDSRAWLPHVVPTCQCNHKSVRSASSWGCECGTYYNEWNKRGTGSPRRG